MRLSLVTVSACLCIVSGVFLSGCAATKPQVKPVEVFGPDLSDPTSPVLPLKSSSIRSEVDVVSPIEPLQRGSFASIVHKMEKSPYTLYWASEDSYSFYVGGVLSAKYKPGDGLVVQDENANSSGVICELGESPSDAKKVDSACTALMFTLDDELGE